MLPPYFTTSCCVGRGGGRDETGRQVQFLWHISVFKSNHS